MRYIKHLPIVIVALVVWYACHTADVASMPGPNQSLFLSIIYATQFLFVLAIILGHCLGKFFKKLPGKHLTRFALVASVGAGLCAFFAAGAASMNATNQLGFLGTFFGTQVILVLAVVFAPRSGAFAGKHPPAIAE